MFDISKGIGTKVGGCCFARLNLSTRERYGANYTEIYDAPVRGCRVSVLLGWFAPDIYLFFLFPREYLISILSRVLLFSFGGCALPLSNCFLGKGMFSSIYILFNRAKLNEVRSIKGSFLLAARVRVTVLLVKSKKADVFRFSGWLSLRIQAFQPQIFPLSHRKRRSFSEPIKSVATAYHYL